ncbi:hypothetical protein [Caldilinea sp.]|jgi:hypothetical protein|uniref:hypothetical protein n=1 Tax=Caldilinea sp. TaxID=2293560 RepID=UPI0021DF3A23|nr:hypothetical protein [Caldilinea sp.]GIV69346.1 MAG: hypothetical protein KatS3mg048_2208 [Caldilinea sp.]
MTQIVLYVNGQLVGVVENEELTQRRRASVHMLRSPRGWAVDDGILRQARELGAVRVRIIDTETGANYTADIAAFDAHGVPVDRGYGKQTALPLRYWRQQAGNANPQAAAVGMAQPALFNA